MFFLEFKHFCKTHRASFFLFIRSFFTCCFVIILCINAFYLFILFHYVQTHWMKLFCFCSLFCNRSMLMLSTFCNFCITSGTKEKTKSFNLTSSNLVMKFKYLNMKNLFACIITSENNIKQYLVSYFYKHGAFLSVFL